MIDLLIGELVKQVDSEMPGTRMTMFIQGEQPKFLISAKTGISEWVCVDLNSIIQTTDFHVLQWLVFAG